MQSDADAAEPLAGRWDDLVLDPKIQAEILYIVDLIHRRDPAAPRGVLLVGPPGTGKTEIARRIANSLRYVLLGWTSADLTTLYIGQGSNPVKQAWERARARSPCLMLIDDCEGIFARRGLNRDSVAEELMMIFLAEWERVPTTDPGVRVIGVTHRRELLDDMVLRRFGTIIEIGLPDEPQRQRMFQLMLGGKNLDFDCRVVSGELAGLTPGAAGRHIKRIVDGAWMHAVARDRFPNFPLLTRADLLARVPARPAN